MMNHVSTEGFHVFETATLSLCYESKGLAFCRNGTDWQPYGAEGE